MSDSLAILLQLVLAFLVLEHAFLSWLRRAIPGVGDGATGWLLSLVYALGVTIAATPQDPRWVFAGVVLLFQHRGAVATVERLGDGLRNWVVVQLAHITTIVLAWWICAPDTPSPDEVLATLAQPSAIVVMGGVIVVVWPVGEFIRLVTAQWAEELEVSQRGLTDAGLWIGRLERLLILAAILAEMPLAIGFLVAAKSVFRIGEVRESGNRKDAEYILIGTLLSFGLAIAVGAVARWALLAMR